MMLPLSEGTYANIRQGKLASFRTDPADFVVPSKHLFCEVIMERPLDMGGEALEGATRSLLWCALAQVAALSRVSVIPGSEPLRVMSFAAAPASKQRLEANGFRPVGTPMRDTDIPVYERLIEPIALGYDFLFSAVANLLSQAIDGPPPE